MKLSPKSTPFSKEKNPSQVFSYWYYRTSLSSKGSLVVAKKGTKSFSAEGCLIVAKKSQAPYCFVNIEFLLALRETRM